MLLLLLSVLLASRYPEWGALRMKNVLDAIGLYGVAITFFLYGLKLNPADWKESLSLWSLHRLVQGTTFLLFPFMAILLAGLLLLIPDLSFIVWYGWYGIFFLCALPSTVSSSVVMVAAAGGQVPAAVLNAGVSSLAGIVLTPLWMRLGGLIFMGWISQFLTSSSGEFVTEEFSISSGAEEESSGFGLIWKLLLQIVFPILLGMVLQKWGGAWARKNQPILRWWDQLVIAAIVFQTYAVSFYEKAFEEVSLGFLLALTLTCALLFIGAYQFLKWRSKALKLSRATTITALFCGSKKSLVHGTIIGHLLFKGNTYMGILLLPIMIYHSLQLVVVAWLVGRWNQQKSSPQN